MDATEIMLLVEMNAYLKRVVHGVHARDTIPRGRDFIPGMYFIINTEDRASIGRHWTIATRSREDPAVVQFYDPLGLPPSAYGIFFRDVRKVMFNSVKVQSGDSILCGLYCLDYAFWSSAGVSMEWILARFHKDLARNDQIVRESAGRLFL